VVQNRAVSEAPGAPATPVQSARAATPRPAPGQTLEVSKVADNLPFVLRTFVGISALGVGANVIGVIVLTLIVGAINSSVTDHQQHVVLAASAIVLVALVVLGISSATFIQRRTLRWLLRGERPSLDDARRALRMPRDMAVIAAVLWTVGAAAIAPVLAVIAIDVRTVVTITGSIIVAGLSSAGVTYLLIGRVSHPVALLALESCPPQNAPVFGVRWRLLLIWVLTSGLPVIGLVLILTGPHGKRHVVGASIVVACIALIVGGLSTALAARAIGAPLHKLVGAFHEVAEGHLDTTVQIEDGGEIGLVQGGFNEMVAGLRERDRVKDLFGRHVGSSVAQEALRSGVTLSGEVRDVVTVFVDITGSTKMSRETDPKDFVAMLNRFFEIVVDEVERNGGLLNKFEGDAALCIFGAPVELIDPASSALRAARQIRDRVFATSEVEVGVGVAAGPVVAGQVGTQSRLEFTVIGDAVNEAARLTDLAKKVRQHLLASSEAIERASDRERAEWDEVGSVVLRGREVPTRIWTA
jgi:adenylate cyclase